MEKHLHIVCFTLPYPVNYGGVFDLFHKLEALSNRGIKIHLHCFLYNNAKPTKVLKAFCESVHYYKRSKSLLNFFSPLPFIVAGRRNKTLLNNLLKDDYPILIEGIQCTYLLNDNRFTNRIKSVRIHNIESTYYTELVEYTRSFWEKIYYKSEAIKLKHYEKAIQKKADCFMCVSPKDAVELTRKGFLNVDYLPVFVPTEWYNEKELTTTEKYCLYQGDLSVSTNTKIAEELILNVFSKLNIQFIIAGKNPPEKLVKLSSTYKNIKVIISPSNNEMQQLIANAHINILPSQNTTGVKLKLLNALFNGKFCITDKESAKATQLYNICSIANTTEEIVEAVKMLNEKTISDSEIRERKEILKRNYNNEESARQIIKLIWKEN